MEFCMSDNIRNKIIFETKIAKIAKKQPKSNILKKWLQRCTMGMSSLTLQKNSGDSRMYSYCDMDRIKLKF